MKYGIICAMESEMDLLKKDIVVSNIETIAKREFIEGNLYGNDVVLVLSRIGKVAASSTATTLIDKYNVDKVVFCGVAGSVAHDLNVGDVVISDCSVQHDFWAGVYFEIPRLNVSYFKADQTLIDEISVAVNYYLNNGYKNDIPQEYLEKFNINSPKAVVGTVASGDQFIASADKKDWLLKNVENIKCVEMEGAAVAQVCYEFDLPYVIIRVISDSANDEAGVDFELFVEKASVHFTQGIIKAWLTHQA